MRLLNPLFFARKLITPLLGILVAVALTVLGLAGCSVDKSGQDSSKPTIRIGYQTFPSGDLIVKNNKWLEEALPDYNIKWVKFDSGADVNTAFIAKELDFGALGSSPVARGLSAPLNIPYKVAFVLDVAGDNEALVARNGSGVNTIADLRGKRVGTPFASTAHYSLLAALAQNNLSPADVHLVDLQPQAILAAWERGDIDAAYTWLPTLDDLRKNGKDLITSRQLATDGKPTLDLAVVADDFAAAHPEVVDKWRQQEARALTTIKDDPDAAAKAIAAEIGLSPDVVAGQLKQGVYLTPEQVASPEWLGADGNPGNIATNLESASQFLAEQKQIPAAAPLKTLQDAIYTKGLPDVLKQ
jgi:taurine transport system substrate-binding protein